MIYQHILGAENFQTDTSEQTSDADRLEEMPKGLPAMLDWDAYFERFKEKHGEPILYKDRILFPDGWSYSSRAKSGPEYPPPAWPHLHKFLTIYWRLRLKLVTMEYKLLEDSIRALREIQSHHSEPLLHSVAPEGGKGPRDVLELDIDALEHGDEDGQGRLGWLQHDIEVCNTELETLNRLYKPEREYRI